MEKGLRTISAEIFPRDATHNTNFNLIFVLKIYMFHYIPAGGFLIWFNLFMFGYSRQIFIHRVWLTKNDDHAIETNFWEIAYNLFPAMFSLLAYGVVVTMFDFHRSDRGSNPGCGGKIS